MCPAIELSPAIVKICFSTLYLPPTLHRNALVHASSDLQLTSTADFCSPPHQMRLSHRRSRTNPGLQALLLAVELPPLYVLLPHAASSQPS